MVPVDGELAPFHAISRSVSTSRNESMKVRDSSLNPLGSPPFPRVSIVFEIGPRLILYDYSWGTLCGTTIAGKGEYIGRFKREVCFLSFFFFFSSFFLLQMETYVSLPFVSYNVIVTVLREGIAKKRSSR